MPDNTHVRSRVESAEFQQPQDGLLPQRATARRVIPREDGMAGLAGR